MNPSGKASEKDDATGKLGFSASSLFVKFCLERSAKRLVD
ncbi:hypothetical protein HMPREF3205_00337 [Streptococcus pasteurianus]|nr:hypothetical protein HMPREF3205_00337 [Streptococcus pasteurianus]